MAWMRAARSFIVLAFVIWRSVIQGWFWVRVWTERARLWLPRPWQLLRQLATDGAAPIAEDGGWGPITLNAVNGADPAALLEAFKAKRLAYYQDIANEDPAKTRYLATWTTRAEM